MSNLRKDVIKLASENPDGIRAHLVPLLAAARTMNPNPWPEGVEPLPSIAIQRFVVGTLVEEKDFYSAPRVWKIYRFKADTHFSILQADLSSLKRLGLTRIGINGPGLIDLYFGD